MFCQSTFSSAHPIFSLAEGAGKPEEPMPSYEIYYLNASGKVANQVKAECADDHQAKILAHALKGKGFMRIKVRTGLEHKLVYQRPALPSWEPERV